MTNCKRCGNNEKHISHSPEVVDWHAFQPRAHIVAGQFRYLSYRFDRKARALRVIDTDRSDPLVFSFVDAIPDTAAVAVAELLCQAYEAGFSECERKHEERKST